MTEVPSSAHEPRQVDEINKSSAIEHCFERPQKNNTGHKIIQKYRADLEELLTYGTNAADSHLINAFRPLYNKRYIFLNLN